MENVRGMGTFLFVRVFVTGSFLAVQNLEMALKNQKKGPKEQDGKCIASCGSK